MQLILETKKEIEEYLDYVFSKNSEPEPTPSNEAYGESYIDSFLNSKAEITSTFIESEIDKAKDIQSKILSPEVVTKTNLQNRFPSKRGPYHSWTNSDIHTLHACATSPNKSIRKLSYITSRLQPPITVNAVKAKLNKLGYSVKEINNQPGEYTVCQPD